LHTHTRKMLTSTGSKSGRPENALVLVFAISSPEIFED